jgi:molybdenum cofactor biosynthesis enzyme MoaA
MPEDGVELQPANNMLSDEEVLKIATLFVNEGVNKIRVTGGEPTVRKGIMELMGAFEVLLSSR